MLGQVEIAVKKKPVLQEVKSDGIGRMANELTSVRCTDVIFRKTGYLRAFRIYAMPKHCGQTRFQGKVIGKWHP